MSNPTTPEVAIAAAARPMGTTCFCGCDEAVAGKAIYRPGHDARHVSQLVKGYWDPTNPRTVQEFMANVGVLLPSQPLQFKAQQMYIRMELKAAKPKRQTTNQRAEAKALPTHDPEGHLYEEFVQAVEAEEARVEAIRFQEVPDVKVGRWFYPAREVYTDNGIHTERNSKRDGSGEWVTVGGSFRAN